MNRLVPATTAVVTVLLLAACGSSTAAGPAGSSSSSSGSSSGGRGFNRNGTAGELVKITGSTLILNTQQGDATVDASNATVSKTSTGTVADIVQGACVIITGRKDSSGAITATMVRLSQPVNGACTGPGGGGGPGGFGGPDGAPPRTPDPSASPRPGAGNFGGVRGLVTTVNGTQVTVQPPNGTPQTVTVPTTVQVSHAESATLADLNLHDCVLAIGTKNSSGTVVARSVNVVPAGPSGCFTGGGFGGRGGRFPGGGRDGGGGGGG